MKGTINGCQANVQDWCSISEAADQVAAQLRDHDIHDIDAEVVRPSGLAGLVRKSLVYVTCACGAAYATLDLEVGIHRCFDCGRPATVGTRPSPRWIRAASNGQLSGDDLLRDALKTDGLIAVRIRRAPVAGGRS